MSGAAERPVAVVTGAERGMGAAVAARLAAEGFDLLLTAPAALDASLTEVRRLGARATGVEADLQDPAGVGRVIAAALAGPRVDALVNVAGAGHFGGIEATPPEVIDDLLALNVRAPWLLVRGLAGALAQRAGAVVNVSSVHAQGSREGFSAYAATKGALDAMTRQLAVELAPRGIRVNAVAPGLTRVGSTGIEQVVADLGDKGTPRRWNDPAEVASVVAFLASPAAARVSGEVIRIDGGLSVRLPDLATRPGRL